MTPQELKNSILQLAIQGKLVEQRADEGTGAELLEKILAAKNAESAKKNLTRSRGVRGGCNEGELFNLPEVVKSQSEKFSATSIPSTLSASPREEIPDDEKTFDIPESWEWVRLGEVLRVIGGVSYDKKDVANTGFRILRGGNIQNMKVILAEDDVFLPAQYEDEDKLVRVGDILVVASTGSKSVIGKGGYVDRPLHNTMIGAFLRICRPSSFELADYLRIIFESDFYRKHIRVLSQGTNINNVKESYITQFAIPLPPLAEQKRIVTKIEELMPLVDRYEKAWSRLEDFNKRFPVDMQKSLLQMAIQGKLVEQRAEEGTGAELLEKIFAVKDAKKNLTRSRGARGGGEAEVLNVANVQQLPISNTSFQLGNEERGMRKLGIGNNGNGNISTLATLKNLSALSASPRDKIPDDEKPFEIPESWEWARIWEVFNLQAGKNIKSEEIHQEYSSEHKYKCYGGNGCRGYVADYNRTGHHVLIGRQGALCGNINYAEGNFYATEHAVVVEQFAGTDVYWCGYFLDALNLNRYATATAQPGLAVAKINQVPIPLPPLAEQKRIVAKLEELLPLCERLK